ncbi:MAG: selenocysteine-specific translation elongation factor [Eubacteriales bacterium]|nr:selenocysteine-specific translation elongation factor [Eubacteriales bacterium]
MENVSRNHNVIVGTAGHVDHGKTCLIKALTGVNTDRLKEEQKRGITIEAGFAQIQEVDGVNIGIIDVPGHEKFIKNMLAGIGGIDIVLLVIAADEGIMPQTLEHFEIIKMLNIEHGITVITKIDLVDEEWLGVVRDDVEKLVKGTFLEGGRVIEVSSYTGQNINELKQLILDTATTIGERRSAPELFRLPVDRVFTMPGFGTVVTGTLIEGSVSVGDEIEVYPQEKYAKVRSVQSHGKSVEKAFAGQRTAINLTGIKKEEIRRGDILAAKGSLKTTMMTDVRIDMFNDSRRSLKNGSRLHFYYGSAEVLCKAVLLERESLESGENGFAQLRMEETIAVKKGDRFILRFYSPLETIGGGVILDANPTKRKRFAEDIIEGLIIKETGDNSGLMEQTLLEESKKQTSISQIAAKLGYTAAEAKDIVETLSSEGRVVKLQEDLALHTQFINQIISITEKILKEYHKVNPISTGMRKEELRSKLEKSVYFNDNKISSILLRHFVKEGIIRDEGNEFALKSFKRIYGKEQQQIRERLLATYERSGFDVPHIDDVIASEKDKNTTRQMLELLVAEGKLEKITYQYYIDAKRWKEAIEIMEKCMQRSGSMTLAEFRELLGTSRKYAIIILEAFDERKMTRLEGDKRIKL